MNKEKVLEKETMKSIFGEMGKLIAADGKTMEIVVFGGSALALSFDWRESTMDIDYMPVSCAEYEISGYIDAAMKNLSLPDGLLRSDVQIFAADNGRHLVQGDYPAGHPEGYGLRVLTASPEYILAMKILSMRSSLETQDPRDVWKLLDELQITKAEDAIKLVQDFYPNEKIPLRNQRILEDIIGARENGDQYTVEIGW